MAPTTYASIEVATDVPAVEAAKPSTTRRVLVAAAALLVCGAVFVAVKPTSSQAPASVTDRTIDMPARVGKRAQDWAARRASESVRASPFGRATDDKPRHHRRMNSEDEPGFVHDIYTHTHHDVPIAGGAKDPVLGGGNAELPIATHDVYDGHHSQFSSPGQCRIYAKAYGHCMLRDGPGPGGIPHRYTDAFCFRCPQDTGFGSNYCFACEGDRKALIEIFGGGRRMTEHNIGKWMEEHDGFRIPAEEMGR